MIIAVVVRCPQGVEKLETTELAGRTLPLH